MNIYQTNNGPCPYLPCGQWITDVFYTAHIPDRTYETLLENGWRRSGCSFYRNSCPDCTQCLPVRVDVGRFCPDRSQKRTLKRNSDVSVERVPAVFHPHDYALYKHYCASRHSESPSEADYRRFLVQSPLTTHIMRYRKGTALIAVAWIDILPGAVSSVYCAYDPACAGRSPGTLSILLQIALCRELHKPWLYLGFYIPACARMSYKARYRPHQIWIEGRWRTP